MASITHKKVNNIPDWTQADVNTLIAQGLLPPGTVLADLTLHSDWNDTHNISGLLESVVGGSNVTIDNTDPENPIINASGGSGSQTLSQTLALGNSTSGNNIEMTASDVIKSPSATGTSIILDDTYFTLSTDNGNYNTPYITADATKISFASLGSGEIDMDLGSISFDHGTLIEFLNAAVRFNALTASRVPYLDASKNLVTSSVTPTELGYLSGVTSALQTQLNDKLEDITGLVTNGSNVTITGTGTAIDPYVINSSGGAAVDWGDIGGTLSDQTDLQTALDGKVDENTAITGATKTKITYDAKGLVTAGADATTADIADSSNKRYVTDANLTVISNTSGTNTGDQTSIVGISGTKAQFNTALSDGDFLFVGDITQYTDEMAQDAVGAMVDSTLVYVDATPSLARAAISGDITIASGSNTAAIGAGVIVNADINATAAIDASKIADGTVSSTEFQYINSLTSNAQTQIDGKATKALDNLASVAINVDLLPGTSDGAALGSITKQWSDLFLAEGGVINWDNGDATLTQVGNVVTLAGADLAVPDDAYGAGWDGSTNVPTKNALYDKIEAIAAPAAASQADQETATSTTTYVSPGRQQYHPSAAKFWCKAGVSGTASASYNVTSIGDTATGRMTVTIATDFSSANWAAEATIEGINQFVSASDIRLCYVKNAAQAAGTVEVDCVAPNSAGSFSDPTNWHVIGFGDQ